MYKKLTILTMVIILAGAGCGLVSNNVTKLKPEEKKVENTTVTTTENTIDTTSWNTYADEKYGFSVRYPAEYTIINLSAGQRKVGKSITDKKGTGSHSETYIDIYTENWLSIGGIDGTKIDFIKLNLKTLEDIKSVEYFKDAKNVAVNNMMALEKNITNQFGDFTKYVIFLNPNQEGKYIILSYYLDGSVPEQVKRKQLFDFVLSTFQFNKP